MKKIQQTAFGDAHVLTMIEAPMPTLQQGEVLIQDAYTSINFADIKMRRGTKGNKQLPLTLGLDVAGTIVASNSAHFHVGERVLAFSKEGSYAQFVMADEQLTYRIPHTLSFTQAAAMPTVSFLAAILVNEIASVQPHDSVVIHSAAGGVGSMLVQLCRQKGAYVIATVGSAAKYDAMTKLGAHVVCTYEQFVDDTLAHTNGLGATIVFDCVAGDVTTRSLSCLAPFGTLVQFGNSSGQPSTFSTNDVHASCRSVKGFSLGTTRQMRPAFIRPYAEKMIEAFANETLTLPIDRIFPLTQVVEAHTYFERRQHVGKVLLDLACDDV